jgi:hypothetical protein
MPVSTRMSLRLDVMITMLESVIAEPAVTNTFNIDAAGTPAA